MDNFWSSIGEYVPFLMAGASGGTPKVEIRIQRVVEAAVIAGLLALFGYLAIIPRLEERIAVVREDVKEVKNIVNKHINEGHPGLQSRVNRLEEEEKYRRLGK